MTGVDENAPSLRALLRGIDRFVHAPADPHIAATIRIAVGILVFTNFVATASFVELWWSEHGFLPYQASKLVLAKEAWTVFDWLPHTDFVLWTCWSVAAVQAALLAAGVFSRFQAASLFVWLYSFNNRNTMITDGEDTVFRLIMLCLVFLPAAWDVWSFDAWFRKKLGKSAPPLRDGWALRIMQLVMCIVLLSAGLEKLNGNMWWSGTAMYYVMHLDDFFGHYPVPEFVRSSVTISRMLTWPALWIEIGAPILIWFKETRRIALVFIFLLHLGIDYMMNLFLFEWIMLAGWLSHADRTDLDWLLGIWRKLTRRGGQAEAGAVSQAHTAAEARTTCS